MKIWFLTVICSVVAVTFSGCGKKAPKDEPASASAPAAKQVSAGDGSAEAAPPPPPPGDAGAPAEAAPQEEQMDAYTKVLTALQGFAFKYERPPKDLNELVTAKLLTSIPPAPPGKKIVYDPAHLSLKLVNQ